LRDVVFRASLHLALIFPMKNGKLSGWREPALLAPDDQRGLLNGRPPIFGHPIGSAPAGCHLFQLPPKCIQISESSHARFWRILGHRGGLRNQWGQGIEIGTNLWPSLIESRRTARFRRLLQLARNGTPLGMQLLPLTARFEATANRALPPVEQSTLGYTALRGRLQE
jgi:hypothetical protein